jgi:hypothetical protein
MQRTFEGHIRALLQVARDRDAIVATQTATQYAPNSATALVGLTGGLALAGRLDETGKRPPECSSCDRGSAYVTLTWAGAPQ